ncbi:MAG: CHAT domain-containing tetratricopeptide repeat protein [Smithellaceae bacterium]|nr:CHAT domain-containing tetratricopeptide repeat protein [Smithellaceae bacterium]
MAKKLYGEKSAGTAPAIDRIASVYRARGQFRNAEEQLGLAFELVRKELGENHRYTVSALNNLAGLLKEMGRYGDAEKQYLSALAILKTLPDTTPEDETGILNNLAVLYMNTSRYSDAEPLLKKILKLAEKATGRDWLDEKMNISRDRQKLVWGRQMMNLANLYFNMKRYDEAESHTLKALEIFRSILGEDHPEVARVKSDLGELYSATRQGDKAEKMLTEAINNALKVYGNNPHPVVAEYYVSLAQLYQNMGLYREALPFARLALDMLQKTVGKENPKTLRSMNNIAVIHINLGEMKTAEKILREVLETAKAVLGENHQSVATNMSNLGNVLAAQGRHNDANKLFASAINSNEHKREDAFLILSEQQKLNYINSMLLQVQLYLSHLVQHGPFNNQAVVTAMNIWLRWKGSVMEAQGRYVDALYSSDDPTLQNRFDELAQVQRELAKAQLSPDEERRLKAQGRTLRDLSKRKEDLEAELSWLSREFTANRLSASISLEKLSGFLPKNSVYIDFAEIAMADFSLQEPVKPRYVAFVLIPGRENLVRFVDIADRDTLNSMLRDYLSEMKKMAEARPDHDRKLLDQYAADIYQAVFKPLIPLFSGRENLFVSPDGALNLIPFEILKGLNTGYIVEEFQINYTASGRELLRNAAIGDTVAGPAIIIADPDFDMAVSKDGKTASILPDTSRSLRGTLASDFSGVHFDRLPDTKQEADSIAAILSGSGIRVHNYQGRDATEKALFSSRNPRILHLATHGYFLKDSVSSAGTTRGLKLKLKGSQQEEPFAQVENPMLRSGIVLAGANKSLAEGSDEGVVSAEKILGLRLRGTDLVTLSACETAVGDVKTGEGVFGLKRAFLLSGAKTLVMSLWSVPSAETTELMTEFYLLMSRGASKSKALREAKLKMMKQKPHPFYWGAFIMIGKPD